MTVPLAAADDPHAQPRGYHQELRWVAGDGSVDGHGLFLSRPSEEGLVARFLVESPGGRRVVLTHVLLARSGRHRARLLDETTGWWVEVEKRFGIEGESLWDFFLAARQLLDSAEDLELEYTVRTRAGFEGTARVPVLDDPEIEHAVLVEKLREAGEADALRGEIPGGLEEALLFLHRAMGDVGTDASAPVDVLAGLLGAETSPYAYLTWKEEAGPVLDGLTLSEPATIRFAAGFGSARDVQPLPLDELDVWLGSDGER